MMSYPERPCCAIISKLLSDNLVGISFFTNFVHRKQINNRIQIKRVWIR